MQGNDCQAGTGPAQRNEFALPSARSCSVGLLVLKYPTLQDLALGNLLFGFKISHHFVLHLSPKINEKIKISQHL